MSCFIVEPECIQAQAAFIAAILNAPTGYNDRYRICADDDLKDVFKACRDRNGYSAHKIYRTLYIMNLRAYNGKYKIDVKEFEKYVPTPAPADLLRLYSYIDCYLYQCAEEPVHKTPLYNVIESLQNRLARTIITRLPNYKAY